MRNRSWIAVACALIVAPAPSMGQSGNLDAQRFDALLKAARQYAEDRTLINYCLRRNAEMVPFLYAGLHFDTQDALQRLRSAGTSDRQNAEMVQAILGNVRFASRDVSDPRLDKECVAKDVEKSFFELRDVGAPLVLRTPFRLLKP
jgi:hypothetical protein